MTATSASLLGADFAAVCERYGAPESCAHVDGVLKLRYRLKGGGARDDAIELVDGVVVREAPGIARSARPCCHQELVGLPIEHALPRLVEAVGLLVRSESLGDSSRLHFAAWVVTTHEGTVACIVPTPALPRD